MRRAICSERTGHCELGTSGTKGRQRLRDGGRRRRGCRFRRPVCLAPPAPGGVLDPGEGSRFGFFRQADGFLRLALRQDLPLEITIKGPDLVQELLSANKPLMAGAGLSVVFGLGLLSWIRKSRRDPLAI